MGNIIMILDLAHFLDMGCWVEAIARVCDFRFWFLAEKRALVTMLQRREAGQRRDSAV